MTTVEEYLLSRRLPTRLASLYGLECSELGIVIPIRDPSGVVVGTQIRVWGDSQPKYLTESGTSVRDFPFGLDVSKRRAFFDGAILVVEGPFDCMAATSAGVPAVAVLGSKMSKKQAFWVGLYVRRAFVCADRDKAGVWGARKSASVLRSSGVRAVTVLTPGRHDLADVWASVGYPHRRILQWWKDLLYHASF